jgi:xanthine dehydrogenase accessory factor
MPELLAEVLAALESGRECVYCAVVETRGSTPQKAGATMLVYPDGSQQGTLGGGCVEAEVRRRALAALGSGLAEVHTFHLDDNYGWDDGLICGGRMAILSDPFSRSASERQSAALAYHRTLLDLVRSGQGCTEAVVLDGTANNAVAGNRYLFNAMGESVAMLGSEAVSEDIQRHLKPLQDRPRCYVQHGVAYLPVLPRITLLIVGGGHVGHAVAHLAASVDFDIWILDDRERFADAERFPMAQRRFTGAIGPKLKELVKDIGPNTYCLIMTRGHAHDEEALYHLAGSRAGYVGMIGSKRKKRLIYEDLRAEGITDETLTRVHSPLGLPIGSQTVAEIAISIVAELIACRNLGPAGASS